jgi:superfamily II DNA or RNA helicase
VNEPGNGAESAAPMPPGPLTEVFSKVSYRHQFRRYQTLALEAFEKARTEGRRRAYLVLPPGAGKTVLGLEIARRLGNHTLALGPNTAIQAQWLAQWHNFQPSLIDSSADQELTTPLTALTYQAICNLDSHNPLIDEQAIAAWREGQLADGSLPPDHREVASIHDRADLAHLRQKARATVAQASDHEQLLNLLHPNGRKLIARIKESGQWTIVLDECHHLLEMWGYLVRALVQELGDNVFLVGLTATPPADMEAKEAALYQELFGRVDFEIPTPAVVKEGNLAPYQELVYLTQPLEHEAQYLQEEYIRFLELTTAIMAPNFASVPFLVWLNQRVVERRGSNGSRVSWSRFEQDQPALAQAALRFYVSNDMEIPAGARVREAHRQPLTADDWVALIGDYCVSVLRHSSTADDQQAWEQVHRGLLSLGYVLTRQGVRSYVSPLDRVLLLSASKATAALDILDAESYALGDRLRALILCDFETAGNEMVAQLRGALDPQAGSAAQVLHILQLDSRTAGLDPILVTGKTLACSRATAISFLKWLAGQAPDLRGRLDTAQLFKGTGAADTAWEDVIVVRPSRCDWEPRRYLPLVTQYFEEGRSRCLIGTRGLLGEGWDATSVNVLIDLTGASTSTSVHQMRGRSLRLDPALPRKVADNWDVVCVVPNNPKGAADYARFVRKHRSYDALTAEGEVESGVSHVDSRLSPYGPPPVGVFPTINSSLIARVNRRDAVYDLWGVGKPYENRTTQTVRVHFGRSIGIPAQRLARSSENPPPRFRARLFGVVGSALTAGFAFTMVGAEAAGIAIGTALAAAGLIWVTGTASDYLRKFDSSDALEDFGAAVAEGLRNAGLIGPSLGADSVRVVTQQDGFYRCYLSEASNDEARLFAESLDELLAPLDNAHYIVPRFIPGEPHTPLAALGIALRGVPERLPTRSVVHHAVPSALGANRKRVSAFERAWNRYVSAGSALYFKDPRAQAILEIQRGEDPFAVITQMRTLWT